VLREPPSANKPRHLDQHWPQKSLRFNLWDRFIAELHDGWLWVNVNQSDDDPDVEESWYPVNKLKSVLDLVEAMQRMLGMTPTFHARNINHVLIQTLDDPFGAYDVPSRRNDG
jgi:hypothetical protein